MRSISKCRKQLSDLLINLIWCVNCLADLSSNKFAVALSHPVCGRLDGNLCHTQSDCHLTIRDAGSFSVETLLETVEKLGSTCLVIF